jgi:hypothetical protein
MLVDGSLSTWHRSCKTQASRNASWRQRCGSRRGCSEKASDCVILRQNSLTLDNIVDQPLLVVEILLDLLGLIYKSDKLVIVPCDSVSQRLRCSVPLLPDEPRYAVHQDKDWQRQACQSVDHGGIQVCVTRQSLVLQNRRVDIDRCTLPRR